MADPVFDLSELRALGDDVEALAGALHNQRVLNRLGLTGVRLIRKRTREGIDRHGAPFRPYTDAYRQLKEAAEVYAGHPQLEYGVRRTKSTRDGGLPADQKPVRANLYDSMLSHLQSVVAADLQSVAVAFDRARDEEIAGYQIEDDRDFMGFTDPDLGHLTDQVEGDLADLLHSTLDR